ncbi:MAG: hypothetical protein AB7S38_26450 [Vulcanimicrobiota bacterium]
MLSSFCIIPVRGGSKGIPRKNLVPFHGVSLLEWTIMQAKSVYASDNVFVSTEDEELAQVAENCRVRLVNRPAALAQDDSTTNSVVEHLLGVIDPRGDQYHHFTILQVTSPLRTAEDVSKAEALMSSGEYDSVISAFHEDEAHPAKMYILRDGQAESVAPTMQHTRRQDLPKAYRRNGAIFVCTRDFFDRTGLLWGGRLGLVEMPRCRSVDIDTPGDLERAQRTYEECRTR